MISKIIQSVSVIYAFIFKLRDSFHMTTECFSYSEFEG
jgi:hypothetical protein